jgi:8-oxo-dGTP pyrophosphatase MutT (NUDIX family)
VTYAVLPAYISFDWRIVDGVMKYEKSCGAIVYRKYHGNVQILLIKHVNSGHWSFPKGHMEYGESETQTAIREIMEETSVEVALDTTFRETVTYSPKRGTYKVVVYFLARAKSLSLVPRVGEISEIRWVDVDYAKRILAYDNDRAIVTKAQRAIKSRMY